jgi:glycosyltransferase involved in cell wall biosynthesis
MKKITIVTSGHSPFDERIYWKFARTLQENGFTTSVVCSTMDITNEEDIISIKGFNGENLNKKRKINKLTEYLSIFQPDIIICCEPLTILAAAKYGRKKKGVKIIADITEWYPENVALKYSFIRRLYSYYLLYFFNMYAVNKANALIIGEEGKKKRYDLIAPFRKKIVIGYFPVLKYFPYSPRTINTEFVLGYAGTITLDRGIKMLLRVASEVAIRNPNIRVKVKLLGIFQSADEQKEFFSFSKEFNNIDIEYAGTTTYDKISDYLKDVHICFDLRVRNFIYNNSLPIKIFEYMALGKPFIFSDIKPLREEPELGYCGQLVNPNDLNAITEAAGKYLKDRGLLSVQARNGRILIEKEKNWEMESSKLLALISRI